MGPEQGEGFQRFGAENFALGQDPNSRLVARCISEASRYESPALEDPKAVGIERGARGETADEQDFVRAGISNTRKSLEQPSTRLFIERGPQFIQIPAGKFGR